VVLVVLGILAAAGVSRYGHLGLGTLGAEAEARRVALDMFQARRRAIATGENHYLLFQTSGGKATSYTMYRRTGGGDTVVEAVREIPGGVDATVSHTTCEFNFEGQALAAYQVSLAADSRSWSVNVVPVTGTARVTEN